MKQQLKEKKTSTPKFLPITIFPHAFETFDPMNQVGSDLCVRWVNDSPSFLMTLLKLLFSFNVFLLLFSASILFVSTTHLETCKYNFWTSRAL